MRLPPRVILFPYTTLFRSKYGIHVVMMARELVAPIRGAPLLARGRDAVEIRSFHVDQRGHGDDTGHASRDRKSTRLNSSHGYNSYAVFCLKNKSKILPSPR